MVTSQVIITNNKPLPDAGVYRGLWVVNCSINRRVETDSVLSSPQ